VWPLSCGNICTAFGDAGNAQAFYIDTDAELVRWVSTHPEYSPEAVAALAHSVADYRGLLKAKRAALLEKVTAAAAGSGV
jgi:hypothetical protein